MTRRLLFIVSVLLAIVSHFDHLKEKTGGKSVE